MAVIALGLAGDATGIYYVEQRIWADVASPLTVRGIRRFDRELAINKEPSNKFYRYGNKKASRLVLIVGLLRYRGDCRAILSRAVQT